LKLQTGLTLAIEPMVNLGTKSVIQEKDGWTIRTKDRKPSAHFEHTIVVRKDKAEILTSFDYIEKALQ
jgi:methionyl aminopeptidase